MKEIKLTKGQVALVDDEDYEWLSQWRWHFSTSCRGYYYACRNTRNSDGKRGLLRMHRAIMSAPQGMHVDHINGNGLDNRRNNLRICTAAQNRCNQGKTRNNTSGFKGVYWHEKEKRWRAQIRANGKKHNLGSFKNRVDAARAYNAAALRLHSEFAVLNELPNKTQQMELLAA